MTQGGVYIQTVGMVGIVGMAVFNAVQHAKFSFPPLEGPVGMVGMNLTNEGKEGKNSVYKTFFLFSPELAVKKS